jgi:hypothetical protein
LFDSNNFETVLKLGAHKGGVQGVSPDKMMGGPNVLNQKYFEKEKFLLNNLSIKVLHLRSNTLAEFVYSVAKGRSILHVK